MKQQTPQEISVEIWSDVMCPFCYIGKRRFEQALGQFEHAGRVNVQWKSFQLDPSLKTEPNKNVTEHLAEKKGWTLAYAKDMNSHVTNMAKEAGLDYHFDKAVVANSFKAHRLSHLAAEQGLGDAMEEQLFKAYFTEGRNIDDNATLTELGTGIGLDANNVSEVLTTDRYANEVNNDMMEAQAVGVRGVPFFVINRKYAVSGAQGSEVFLGALNRAWSELEPAQDVSGQSCDVDGNCD